MSKQKKGSRNKKYDPAKRLRMLTRGFKIATFERWTDNGQKIAKAWLGGKQTDATTFEKVDKFARDWKLNIYIICAAPDGTQYTEEAEIIARNVHLNDLEDIYLKEKKECEQAVNSSHIVDRGWQAVVLN